MNKYFIIEDEKFKSTWSRYKEDLEKLNDAYKQIPEEYEIESDNYYVTIYTLKVSTTENDKKKFSKSLCKDGESFKKNSIIAKRFMMLIGEKGITSVIKPNFFGYGFGCRYSSRLFEQDGILYGSVENSTNEFEIPHGFKEIKASEFYKVVETE